MEHVIGDVVEAADWLAAQGCKAAPVQAASHSGVVFTQPGSDVAFFAQPGDRLVHEGGRITVESR